MKVSSEITRKYLIQYDNRVNRLIEAIHEMKLRDSSGRYKVIAVFIRRYGIILLIKQDKKGEMREG